MESDATVAAPQKGMDSLMGMSSQMGLVKDANQSVILSAPSKGI